MRNLFDMMVLPEVVEEKTKVFGDRHFLHIFRNHTLLLVIHIYNYNTAQMSLHLDGVGAK